MVSGNLKYLLLIFNAPLSRRYMAMVKDSSGPQPYAWGVKKIFGRVAVMTTSQ